MRMKSKAQNTNISGMKRKVVIDTDAKLNNVIKPSRKIKVPLKEDLLRELEELKEKYIALEEKAKKDIEMLKTENKTLKNINKRFSDELNSLKQNGAQNFRCYECTFETSEKSVLKCHIYDKHAWKKDYNSEELDLTVGPRFCSKCEYKAEDGYDLDGHFWSEHDDESLEFSCKFCDERFPTIKDLMMHKKSKHIENVSFCLNFESNSCMYGDDNCWYVHEPQEEPETFEEFKCNECDEEFNHRNDYLKHRKKNHIESVPICNKFKHGECTFGSEKCWFNHKNESKNIASEEKHENFLEKNEIIQRMLKMMENLTKRITDIEKNKV